MNKRFEMIAISPPSRSRKPTVLPIQTIASLRQLLLAILLTCFITPQIVSADWPLVRGDAMASGAVKQSLPEKLELLWEFSAEESGFEGAALLVDGIVYLGDVDGTFYALRLTDGTVLWKQHFDETGFLAAAAVVEDRIFVGDFNGVVRALQADSGKELWSYTASAEFYAAPNVVENQVLVTTEAGELLSLDADVGKLNWKFQIDAPLRCWPTVVGGRVLLAGCDERLHVVDILSGKEVEGLDIDGPTGSTPAVVGGNVLFGTEQGTFYSIATQPISIAWQYRDPKQSRAIRTAAAVNDRTVVYGTRGKQVYALDPASGKLQWKFAVRSSVESSPIIAGDRVYVATKRGRIYALDIATGKETWQFEAGGGFLASPSVSEGKLVLGNTDGTLYCLGEKNKGNRRGTQTNQSRRSRNQ